jgi:hypothetical protein
MFNDFLRLSDAKPSEVLEYARTWGLIYIDEDQRPRIDPPLLFNSDPAPGAGVFGPGGLFLELKGKVPLVAMRYYSRRLKAVLNIVAAMRGDQGVGSLDDWKILWMADFPFDHAHVGFPFTDENEFATPTVDEARSMLEGELCGWLENVNFIARWARSNDPASLRGQLIIEVDYQISLIPALGLQLGLTVAGAESLFICSGCGLPYVRESRLPRHGHANFCRLCTGDGNYRAYEGLRQADARRRHKIAEARRMRAEGMSVQEIAKALNVRSTVKSTAVQTVRRWIAKGK